MIPFILIRFQAFLCFQVGDQLHCSLSSSGRIRAVNMRRIAAHFCPVAAFMGTQRSDFRGLIVISDQWTQRCHEKIPGLEENAENEYSMWWTDVTQHPYNKVKPVTKQWKSSEFGFSIKLAQKCNTAITVLPRWRWFDLWPVSTCWLQRAVSLGSIRQSALTLKSNLSGPLTTSCF